MNYLQIGNRSMALLKSNDRNEEEYVRVNINWKVCSGQ